MHVDVYLGVIQSNKRNSQSSVLIMVDEVIAVDQQVALRMLSVVAHSTSRVPTIDAIIAATAIQHCAVLLHRDAHFRGIPQTMLHQEELPAPNSMKAPSSIEAKEGK